MQSFLLEKQFSCGWLRRDIECCNTQTPTQIFIISMDTKRERLCWFMSFLRFSSFFSDILFRVLKVKVDPFIISPILWELLERLTQHSKSYNCVKFCVYFRIHAYCLWIWCCVVRFFLLFSSWKIVFHNIITIMVVVVGSTEQKHVFVFLYFRVSAQDFVFVFECLTGGWLCE